MCRPLPLVVQKSKECQAGGCVNSECVQVLRSSAAVAVGM